MCVPPGCVGVCIIHICLLVTCNKKLINVQQMCHKENISSKCHTGTKAGHYPLNPNQNEMKINKYNTVH